ncbi:MAG: sugar phosphate isomerase/epimerase [Oscillospiraceae bacterium]|jgi:sugar phosphate isomerase/epimerase|nr:sugar phosphate isomerase/epimerase [Oscillospiraceae bacterium]
MKVSVSSYSFSQLLDSGMVQPANLIRLAKEIGFAAIEYTDFNLPKDPAQLRDESEKQSLPIVCYAVCADFLKADSVEAEAERLFAQVDIAAALGAKKLRHDATNGFPTARAKYSGFREALPILARGCRMVTEYAAAKGIATMVENHGYFCQDSTRLAALVGAVAHPNFGALVDIGNFLCADEDAAVAVGNVAAMAKHVHAKDFHRKSGAAENPGEGWFNSRGGNYLRGAIIGHGEVPVRQCMQVLKRSGYDDFVSIEFEGMEACEQALHIGRANLERFFD